MRPAAADRTRLAVLALALAGLLARVVALGARPFHWDEARVGYWTLRYAKTGLFEYRPVAGGPFLYVATEPLLSLLGATDGVARLLVAVVGGLLPLAALLFRGHLRDDETVALAAVLALSPLLLYYSRFLRADVPLVAFLLVSVGFFLRARDRDSRSSLYAGAAFAGLAATTSGFVAVHALCLAVAGLVAFDHLRVEGRGAAAVGRLGDYARAAGRWATPGARALFVGLVAALVFYLPRDGEGLVRSPEAVLALLARATAGSVESFRAVRIAGREGHPFLPFVTDALSTLLGPSLAVVALAVVGFLADRYRVFGVPPRSLVTFAAVWGGFGVLAFPVFTEVAAPWVLVHVVAPLSIPAAVGLAALWRVAADAFAREDVARAVGASLLVLAVGLQAGAVVATDVYGPSTPDNRLAHYGQPADDLDALAASAAAASAGTEGPHVVYVGSRFYATDGAADQPPITGSETRAAFGERLPLAWYFERHDLETTSVRSPDRLGGGATPPVVVADPQHRSELAGALDGYEARQYRTALWNREVVVFVRTEGE